MSSYKDILWEAILNTHAQVFDIEETKVKNLTDNIVTDTYAEDTPLTLNVITRTGELVNPKCLLKCDESFTL